MLRIYGMLYTTEEYIIKLVYNRCTTVIKVQIQNSTCPCFLFDLTFHFVILQVVIGGRNKYLINGSNANNTRVQDLFRSVQLNVNNPHFLIMQGRITKVLNMKPPEVSNHFESQNHTVINQMYIILRSLSGCRHQVIVFVFNITQV